MQKEISNGAIKSLTASAGLLENMSRTSRDRFLPNVTGLLCLKIGFVSLSFLLSIILARLLGPVGYGSYTYAFAWMLLLGVPAILGMDQLIVRDVAAYQSKSQWDLLKGLLKKTNQAVLMTSLGLALLAAGISLLLAGHWSLETLWSFWVALLLLPLITLTRLRQSTLQGLHHVALGQLPELLIQPAVFLAFVGTVYLGFGWTLTSVRAMTLNVVATSVAFLAGATILHKLLPDGVHSSATKFENFSWRRSILPLMFLASAGVLFAQTDTLIVGVIKGPRAVGIYGVADRAAETVQFLFVAVCMVFAPTVSKLYAQGESEKLQQRVTEIARITLLLSLPVAFLLIFYSRWFLALFYGPQFVEGHEALSILSVGQLMMVAAGPVGMLLIMTRHEAHAAHAIAISAFTNVSLNFALVPKWNLAGAAFANTASIIILNVLMTFWLIKKSGIQTWPLGNIRFRRQ